MRKERTENIFEGEMTDDTHVRFLQTEWECNSHEGIHAGDKVEVHVSFDDIVLEDDENDGIQTGDVHFILYKGDHYHLTIRTDDGDDLYVNTNDVWDDGDWVGINIPADKIVLQKISTHNA